MKRMFFTIVAIVYQINSANLNPIFNILDINHKRNHDYELLPKEAATELDIDAALTIIDRTITPLGIWALKDLTYPTKDLQLIQQRQLILKELVNNEHACRSLEESLQDMKSVVSSLLVYWNDADVLNVESKSLYFNFAADEEPDIPPSRWQRFNRYLNSSSTALECGRFVGMGMFAAQFVLQKAIINTAFAFKRNGNDAKKLDALGQSTAHLTTAKSFLDGLKATIKSPFITHTPWLYHFKDHASDSVSDIDWRKSEVDSYNAPLSIKDQARYHEDFNISRNASYMTSLTVLFATDGLLIYNLYQQVKALNESSILINKLRARLTKTATILKEAEKLYTLGAQLPALKGLPALQTLERFINNPPQKVQELIKLLHTSTFEGEKSFFYRRGRVLFAHRTLTIIKNELLPLLRAIAEIDAYIAIARLFKEHQNKPNHYCFVNFYHSDEHPQAILTNFWLPLVTTHEPILNSLIIGSQHPENLLLAGPNGCGKSTFMKAIAYNWAILPLSWGIAAADQAVITPLTHIKTSINIKENLQAGQSTYMAQKKRFDQICQTVEDQQHNDRTLFLIDEPLSGTVEAEAADQTVILGNAIAQSKTISAIIATHLELPTHLDEMTGTFTNYYPEVLETTPGYFKQTFKLLPGKADWWFTDRSKRSRFLSWLSKYVIAE